MSRFTTLFKHKSISFFPFFVLGYPNQELCLKLIDDAIAAGADALELGIPFSDPIADGPIIQQAVEKVLAKGFKSQDAFKLIESIRCKHPQIPIGLLVYSQTIEHHGITSFYQDAKTAGVDGVLVADLPIIESKPYREAAHLAHIDPIYIAAPSSTPETLEQIAKDGAGFTYVVTRKGVTGLDQNVDLASLEPQLQTLKQLGAPPPVLGFGIKSQADITLIKQSSAKGYIVGSKLVDTISLLTEQELHESDTFKSLIQSFR